MLHGQDDIRKSRRAWEEHVKTSGGGRDVKFTTVSGERIETLYGPEDVEQINFLSDIGFPGEYPTSPAIAENCGPCVSLPDSAHRRIQTNGTTICSNTAKPDFLWRLIFRH